MEGLSPHVFAAKFVTKTHRVSGKKEPWTWERREEGGLRGKKARICAVCCPPSTRKTETCFQDLLFLSLSFPIHFCVSISSSSSFPPVQTKHLLGGEREMDRKYLQTPLLLTRTMLPPPPPPPRSPWRCKGRGWGKRRIVL